MCGFEYVGENVSVFENLYVGAITIDPRNIKRVMSIMNNCSPKCYKLDELDQFYERHSLHKEKLPLCISLCIKETENSY